MCLVTRSLLAVDRTRRMNEKYGVKGCVYRLEQRNQLKFDTAPLHQTLNHSSFDIEFSLTGQILQKTSFTYGGAVYRSTRFEYDGAGRLIRTAEFDSAGTTIGVSEFVYADGKCVWTYRDAAGAIMSRGV